MNASQPSQGEINQKLISFAQNLKAQLLQMQEEMKTLRTEVKELNDSNDQLLSEVEDLRNESILQRELLEGLANKYKNCLQLSPLKPDTRTEAEQLEDDIKANLILIQESILFKEYGAIQELTFHWDEDFKRVVWGRLSSTEQQQLRNLKIAYEEYEQKAQKALEDIVGDITFGNIPETVETKTSSNLIDFNKLRNQTKASTGNTNNPWGNLSFSTATEAIDGGL